MSQRNPRTDKEAGFHASAADKLYVFNINTLKLAKWIVICYAFFKGDGTCARTLVHRYDKSTSRESLP